MKICRNGQSAGKHVVAVWMCFVLAAMTTGCAVLTIDVDVYKGPLANHPDTQLRQFAAYAIGAKHLLVSARNKFEWPQERDRKQKIKELPFDYVRPHPEYKATEVHEPGRNGRYNFRSESAQLLNSVLSMYDDLGEDDTRSYITRMDELWFAIQKNKTDEKQHVKVREDLQSLWYLAVHALTSVHSPAFYGDKNNREEANRQEKVTRLIVPALSTLTQPFNLACAISVLKNKGHDPANFSIFTTDSESRVFDNPKGWNSTRYMTANYTLRAIIRNQPLKAVMALRRIHEEFKDTKVITRKLITDECGENAGKYDINTFGIVRGWSLGSDEQEEFKTAIADLEQQFRAIEQGGALGFETGRLQNGIETLTRNYLNALDRHSSERGKPHSEVQKTSRQLQDHLIGFAEKIRVVANHRALPTTATEGHAGDSEVFLLQSLSNTLLSFSDELRYRSEHENRLVERRSSELQARNHAFAVSAPEALNALLNELRARAKREDAESQRLLASLKSMDPKTTGATSDTNLDTLVKRAAAESAQAAKLKNEVRGAAATSLLLTGRPIPSMGDVFDSPTLQLLVDMSGKIRAQVTGNKPSPTSESILLAVRTAVSGQSTIYSNISDSLKNLFVQANAYLAAAPQPKSNAPAVGALYDAIAREARQVVEAKQTAWVGYDVSSASALRSAEALKKGDTAQQQRRTEMQGKQKSAAEDAGGYEKAADTITGLRDQLLRDLVTTPGHDAMFAAVDRLLRAKTDADSARALTYLAKVGGAPTQGAIGFKAADGKQNENQRDALDSVLDSLGNELIAATRAGLTERADNLRKAIAVANQRRADMAFIRPASAYLRNANAATSLQSDPSVYWRNLLGEQGLRTLLSGGGALQREENINRVRTEVDKQFWQTVNTVRVAGAGKTDYVVAKDDIGNWYVKSYESDPSSIIRGAQGLAMFNLGRSLDLNLMRYSEISSELRKGDVDPDRRKELESEQKGIRDGSKASVEPLERVLVDYKKRYREKLVEEARSLRIYLESLEANLIKVWRTSGAPEDSVSRLEDYAKKGTATLSTARAELADEKLESDKLPTAKIASLHLSTIHELRRVAVTVELAVANDAGLVTSASEKADSASLSLQSARAAHQLSVKNVNSAEEQVRIQTALSEANPTAAVKSLPEARKRREEELTLQAENKQALDAAELENDKAQKARVAALTVRSTMAVAGRESIIATVRAMADRRAADISRYEQAVLIVQGASTSPSPKK
jgi:hypothetical protein